MTKAAKETRIKGIAASPGIAMGVSSKHELNEQPILRRRIKAAEVEREQARLDQAVASARREVERIKDEAGDEIGPQVAKIFEAQILILDDEAFLREVSADIAASRLNAEYVYNRHITSTLQALAESDDRYLRQMGGDIKGIAAKVLGYLIGPTSKKLRDSRGRIALADSFSPGEVVLMKKYRIPGFASMRGASTSHTVLVARSLSIPAVVGVTGLCRKCPVDCEIIIDGDAGLVVVNPTPETVAHYREEQKKRQSKTMQQLKRLARIPNATADGRQIELLANIDFPSDTDKVLAGAGVGVGLYRTEFFYLSSNRFPSEEEQTAIYSRIAETFFPATVIMRIFDLGSDKMAANHQNDSESNPAMGWRGIRFDLDEPEIFKAQVRAILRASELKNLKIMLPMISSSNEIVRAKKVISAQIEALKREGVKCDERIEIGIMIEVPSAAIMSAALARHVDFFSIGSNDLTQYTLAVDRGNKRIAKLYRELHPGVLRLIGQTIDAGNQAGIPVSICGELARRREAVPLLIGMGLKSLSVAFGSLPSVKKMIADLDYKECARLAERVLELTTAERVEALLRNWLAEHVSD